MCLGRDGKLLKLTRTKSTYMQPPRPSLKDILRMSDEENYDDFMMSDEDGMVEMEDDDDELDADQGSSSMKAEDLYEMGVYYVEEQDWNNALTTLEKVVELAEGRAPLRFKALVQILKLRAAKMHYNDLTSGPILQACEDVARVAGVEMVAELGPLATELFPLPRGFLFDETPTDVLALPRVELQLECLDKLQNGPQLQDELHLRRCALQVWYDRLRLGTNSYAPLHDSQADVAKIEQYCLDHAASVDAEADAFYVSMVSVVLQCYICHCVLNPASRHVFEESRFSEFLQVVEEHGQRSLTLSQSLGIMLQLPLAKALLLMWQGASDVAELKKLFWTCLRQVEEVGGPSTFASRFEKFILCGFIFSCMILYRDSSSSAGGGVASGPANGTASDTASERVNPFDLEYIKAHGELPLVRVLSDAYSHFVHLRLQPLCDSIEQLPLEEDTLHHLLGQLIDRIYYAAQIAKLWTRIAPVFSCISLQDIQHMLQIGETLPPRDYLLTVLMRSIMSDRAAVFYKLDLTRDLVYFGAENKLPLSASAKQGFALGALERGNDVGLWHSTTRLKGVTAHAFFEHLQRERVGDSAHSGQSSFQSRACNNGDLYGELARCAFRGLSL